MTVYSNTGLLSVRQLLSEEHKMIRDATREWVKRSVSPIIKDYAQRTAFPAFIKRNGWGRPFWAIYTEEYGGAGLDHVSYGLMMQKLNVEILNSLYLFSAEFSSNVSHFAYGSEEQKAFSSKLATGEFLGSFGLTEPNFGSNPGGMTTNLLKMVMIF